MVLLLRGLNTGTKEFPRLVGKEWISYIVVKVEKLIYHYKRYQRVVRRFCNIK